MPRLLTSRDAFDDVARSLLNGTTPVPHAALLVGELDDFSAMAEKLGSQRADTVAAHVGRLLVSLLRGDDIVLPQAEGRYLILLPGNVAEEGRQVGERLAAAVRTFRLALAEREELERLSISFGVSAFPDNGQRLPALYDAANAACLRVATTGGDGASTAPLAHHQVLNRPLSIDRFAGRVAELTTLIRYVDESVGRVPRVIAVLGESGLGSGTLVRQIESHVRFRGASMIWAASPESPVREPYAVWAGILRGLHRLPDAPQRDWHELPKLVPALGARPLQTAAGSQYRLLEELLQYLREAAETRPLVLVLDEMQYADGTSWDALEHVIGSLQSERILICLTSRTEREFVDAAERRQILKRNNLYHEITLGRLTRDEVKRWVSGAFHYQEVGRELLAFLYRHTEGNPFFLVQLVSALVEQGALWHSGARWEWMPVSELRLPLGIKSLIAQRLARLSASSQAILTTAAAVGRDFDISLVVDTGAGSEPAVRLAMSEAVAAGFTRPRAARRAGSYGFTHESIAAVLIDGLSREALRDQHRRLAHALVSRRDRAAGEIAGHYDAAQSTGLAFEYACKAAREAERVYALHAARSYLDVAAHNAASPGEVADVRMQLALLSEMIGRYDEVEEFCDLVIEWYDSQKDVRRSLSARRLREKARLEQGQPARVTATALEALDEQARELGLDEEGAAIANAMSAVYLRLGDSRRAERLANEALEMAERLGHKVLIAESLCRLAIVLCPEAPGRSRVVIGRAQEIYESLGDIRGQARCQNLLAFAANTEGHHHEARVAFELALSMSKLAGMPDVAGMAALNLGTIVQKGGDFELANELFAQSMTAFATLRNSSAQLIALFNMAHTEREQSHWAAASELYLTTSSLAERIGHGDIEIGSRAGRGLCHLALGELKAAREAAAEVRQRMDRRPEWFQNRELAEALLIRLQADEGQVEAAFDRLEDALTLAERDEYASIWLVAQCADALTPGDPERMRMTLSTYGPRAGSLGAPALSRRIAQLLEAS